MSSFNKRYIIREAEEILEECNNKIKDRKTNKKISALMKKNKNLKIKNIFWKICTGIMLIAFIMAVV